jgi:hypothetical protein
MIIRPAASARQPAPSNLPQLPSARPVTASPLPPRFGGGAQSGLSSGYRKVLNALDFREMGTSYINQIKVVYAACIGWRLIAANERRKASPLKSWNEVRENALRDSMGFMFWFFATPVLQRGSLLFITKHDPTIGSSLYQMNETVAQSKGFLGKLKAWNPLYSVNIPSSEQVKNQMNLALHHLKEGGITEAEPAFKSTETFYKKLFMYRNIATALGLINTIALIGIGINLLNFYLTRKNMELRKVAMQQPSFPPAPALPKPPASPPPTLPATQPALYTGMPVSPFPPQNVGRLA